MNMSNQDLVNDLKQQLQELEDAKTQITESQAHLRETIAVLEMAKECDCCHNFFPYDELTETNYGLLCIDCLHDHAEIEDRNIND